MNVTFGGRYGGRLRFRGDQMSRLVKYHRDILADVISRLRIDESRFINCCLLESDQSKKFKEEVYYPVDIRRYANLQNIDIGKAIKELIDICEFHRGNAIRIAAQVPSGSIATLHTSLIYSFIYNEEEKTLLINWNKVFIPYISGQMIPGQFITIDSRMDSVSSNRRYSMYVLLEKHLWKLAKDGEIVLSKDHIRSELSLQAGEYREFNVLNSKIIKPTLVEIYNTLGKKLKIKISKGNAVFTEEEIYDR